VPYPATFAKFYDVVGPPFSPFSFADLVRLVPFSLLTSPAFFFCDFFCAHSTFFFTVGPRFVLPLPLHPPIIVKRAHLDAEFSSIPLHVVFCVHVLLFFLSCSCIASSPLQFPKCRETTQYLSFWRPSPPCPSSFFYLRARKVFSFRGFIALMIASIPDH